MTFSVRRARGGIRKAAGQLLHAVGLERSASVSRGRPFNMAGRPAFAEFVTDDGRRLPLFEGYRDSFKSWRDLSWPTLALRDIRNRIPLSPDAQALLRDLDAARTLPASLDEYADALAALAAQHPAVLIRSEVRSRDVNRPIIAAKQDAQSARTIANYYRRLTRRMLSQYGSWSTRGQKPGPIRSLETGCGQGYAVVAMAALGVQSAGVDTMEDGYQSISERPAVMSELGASDPRVSALVSLHRRDMCDLPFDGNEFDFIHSNAVLEHVADLPRALQEMARVLKPGGLMIHQFFPFFGPAGGHAVCTLDFPWGHARLTEAEFCRYVETFRPHERRLAESLYQHHFPYPRVTLSDIEQFISRADLSLLSWTERWDARHVPSAALWREINNIYPSVAARDLAADGITVVMTKE